MMREWKTQGADAREAAPKYKLCETKKCSPTNAGLQPSSLELGLHVLHWSTVGTKNWAWHMGAAQYIHVAECKSSGEEVNQGEGLDKCPPSTFPLRGEFLAEPCPFLRQWDTCPGHSSYFLLT